MLYDPELVENEEEEDDDESLSLDDVSDLPLDIVLLSLLRIVSEGISVFELVLAGDRSLSTSMSTKSVVVLLSGFYSIFK